MTEQELIKKYPYLYETHLHTTEASACANNTGAEMARAAKHYGYTGIFVTDHHFGGNTCVDRSMPWEEWVESFCKGFEHAWEEGQKIGLDVFFGYEAGFHGTEFLIYGVDKDWMKAHPELRTCTIEEQFDIVHQGGGTVIHAHPFREEDYIPEICLFPEFVDGVEAINATHSNSRSYAHNDPAFDDRAVEYARKHKKPMGAGSDIHSTSLFGGGVRFTKRLDSSKDYWTLLQTGEYILTNGEEYYTANGEKIEFN